MFLWPLVEEIDANDEYFQQNGAVSISQQFHLHLKIKFITKCFMRI